MELVGVEVEAVYVVGWKLKLEDCMDRFSRTWSFCCHDDHLDEYERDDDVLEWGSSP